VLVFFVLSGLVLALPYASVSAGRWRAYYAARLLRLYPPIVVAAVFAFILVRAVPRHPGPASSWWLASHVSPVDLPELLHNALIVRGTTWMNSALWSLRWEVYFSLMLPLFVLVLGRFRPAPVARAAVLLAMIAYGTRRGHSSLVYLPIFGLGVVMAQQIGRLDAIGARWTAMRRETQRDIVIGTLLLLVSRWWLAVLPDVLLSRFPLRSEVGIVLTVVGACLLVWLFGCTPAARSLAERSVCRWLGKRSFSLYLVHEPIVVTVAYLFHGTTDALLVLAVSLPLSLLAAELFGRLVEVPSQRLARSVARRLQTGRVRL
jgi:peptidoglycan/LPS O-acetylase OafA/YrhL